MRSNHDTGGGGNLDDKRRQFLNMPEKRSSRQDKDWWAPIWRGLVMDQDAAHFQKMGNALWLFLYFLLNANRSTGILVRKVKTISADTGIHRRRIFEWLTILRDEEYITTRSSGRCLEIAIHKWKPLGDVSESAHEKCGIPHTRSAENRTSKTPSDTPKPAWLREKMAAWSVPKKNILKKNNLKKRIDRIDFKHFDPVAFNTREELLAYDLAKALDDFPGFPLYLTLARKHSESYLREALGRVREIPGDKIKTSRGALFNFLIHQNENQPANGAGD